MARSRLLELYGNASGSKPMRLLRTFGKNDLPEKEEEITKAIESAVEGLNSLPREIETQMVVVEDGLIIAVEGLTTRKLIWCN